MPEHPPPRTPILKKAVSGRLCACLSSFTCFAAASDNATAMPRVLPLFGCGAARHRCALLFVVRQRRLDRVLRQHRAVDLHRRQLQLVHDVGVLDLGGLVDRLALQPLGGQARRRDGAAAAERLELGVFDHPGVEVDLDLQLHHVAAFRRADEPRAHPRRVLGEGPDVARVVVVVDDLLAICHGAPPYSAFQRMDFRSTPSFASSYSGDISRKRLTTSIVRAPTCSTSSSVVKRCKLKRIEEWASSALAPSPTTAPFPCSAPSAPTRLRHTRTRCSGCAAVSAPGAR